MWLFPAGTGNNRSAYTDRVSFSSGIPEEKQHLLFTPETSGGLLAAIPPDRIDAVVDSFERANEPLWIIGQAVEGAGVEVLA